jgi:hypothetical protein
LFKLVVVFSGAGGEEEEEKSECDDLTPGPPDFSG